MPTPTPIPPVKIEAPKLWAIYALSNDEYYATGSKEEGERTIKQVCKDIASLKPADNPNEPPYGMVVVPWPGTPEQHASEMAYRNALLVREFVKIV